jgi:hypothetical protein
MKRTCYVGRERACLALHCMGAERPFCSLGYNMIADYDRRLQIYRDPRPLEDCPKPVTNKAFCAAPHKSIRPRVPEGGEDE